MRTSETAEKGRARFEFFGKQKTTSSISNRSSVVAKDRLIEVNYPRTAPGWIGLLATGRDCLRTSREQSVSAPQCEM
jgi:hypothetical protein